MQACEAAELGVGLGISLARASKLIILFRLLMTDTFLRGDLLERRPAALRSGPLTASLEYAKALHKAHCGCWA